jgi:hypothetical protein
MTTRGIDDVASSVAEGIQALVASHAKEESDVIRFYTLFTVRVQTDVEKKRFASDSTFLRQAKEFLDKHASPFAHLIEIHFESRETVDRESDGNWLRHLK